MSPRTDEADPSADPLGPPLARAAFEASPSGLLVLAPDGTVLAMNAAFGRLYGVAPEALVGGHYSTLARGLEVRRLDRAVDEGSWVTLRALRGERVEPVLQTVRHLGSGREFVARCSAEPLFEGGYLVATTVVVEDVTEGVRAQEAVEGALSAAEVGTYRVDLLAGRVWGDANFTRLHGLSEADARGGELADLYATMHAGDLPRVREAVAEATCTGAPHEMEYRVALPGGEERWLLSRGRAEIDAAGRAVQRLGSVVDVTRRRQAESALRLGEARLRAVFDGAAVGMLELDPATYEILRLNPAACAMFGYPEAELLGRTPYTLAHPEDAAVGRADTDALRRDERRVSEFERRYVQKDGAVVWLFVRVTRIPGDGHGPARNLAVMTDVTARRSAEQALRASEASLERRVEERTEALARANRDLDQFAYSVAHDLRAPLRAIVSTSRMLLDDAEDRLSGEEADLLRRQAASGVRLARIVDDLLGFARLAQAEPRKAPFDLSALAQEAAGHVRTTRGSDCEIEVQGGLAAEGDHRLVGYVLTNLLDNACKFSPDGGKVEVGEEGGAFFVRDQGLGFDMAHAGKLFVAFERLVGHEVEGTGVGLANVRRIVEKHGGRVWAESVPGKGATFWFTLA